jgi:hypothetical protein
MHLKFSKSIQSRSRCPLCDGTLYYVYTLGTLFTGKMKRVCRGAGCHFVDPRRWRVYSDRQVW